MNLLVASARQFTPEHEWMLMGIRYLVEERFSYRFNWVLYDRNPDLMQTQGPKTQRPRLKSNSFRHETLLPFSGVVLAGPSQWNGQQMEVLYGALAKSKLPVLGMGLSGGKNQSELSALEIGCLSRAGNVLTVQDRGTQDWLQQQKLMSHLLACPSLFCSRVQEITHHFETSRPKIGVVIHDSQRPESPLNESEVRRLCQGIGQLSKKYEVQVICPTVDDFMRFSTMFRNQTKYSFDPLDYLGILEECTAIVTAHPIVASSANSLLKPVALIGETGANESANLPFRVPTSLEHLTETVASLINNRELPRVIDEWKADEESRWLKVIGDFNLSTPSLNGSTSSHELPFHKIA